MLQQNLVNIDRFQGGGNFWNNGYKKIKSLLTYPGYPLGFFLKTI